MEEQKKAKETLRFSVPPYWVCRMVGDTPLLNLPGRMYELTERGQVPSAEDVREILITLRARLGWSRAGFAALLGVDRNVLRSWETGKRNPSGPAKRLIWLTDALVRRPHKIKDAMSLITWGRGDELLKISRMMRACGESGSTPADY